MSTSSVQLAADIARLHTDAELMHDVIHGDQSTIIPTEGGPVRTVANAINSITQFTYRGAWATATPYSVKDIFVDAGTVYLALVAHTSISIAEDLAAGKIGVYQGSTSDQIAIDGGSLTQFFQSKVSRVVDSISSLRGLDKTLYTRASVTGYYQAGDGGDAIFQYDPADTTSADNGTTIIVASDGGRWKIAFDASLRTSNAGITGAAGDGTKLNSALLAAAARVKVNRATLVDSAILTDGTKSLRGEVGETTLTAPAAFDASTNVITIQPPADGNARESMEISRLYLITNNGKHSIYADLASDSRRLSRMRIDHSLLRSMNGNYAFMADNSTKKADKFSLATFRDSQFDGGIALIGAGDSILIDHCTFTGVNQGLYADVVTNLSSGGAGDSSLLTIKHCNSTANKGIHIFRGTRTKILHNNLEGGAGPGSSNALVFLEGGASERISNAEVVGNYIAAAPNIDHCVRIGACDEAYVAHNTLGVSTTGYGIFVTADAKNTRIGPNTYSPTGSGREILDQGVGTMGVVNALTLAGGWVAYGTGRKLPTMFKSPMDQFVTLSGVAKGGSTGDNTVITTLPAGFIPADTEEFAVHGFGPSAGYTATMVITTTGDVLLQGVPSGGNVSLSFSGIRFFAPLA